MRVSSIVTSFLGKVKNRYSYCRYPKVMARTVLVFSLIVVSKIYPAYSQPGSLDVTFDGDGMVTIPIGNSYEGVYAIMIQPDGKIIAAGYSNSGTVSSYDVDFAVVRYNTDGSLDSTFDGDGKVTTDFGSIYDYATGALLQPDGKIVVCGRFYVNGNFNYGCAMARYNPDGSLDNTFDGDGKATHDISSMDELIFECAIQPDGKILAAGYSFTGSQNVFAVLRFNASGSLDNTFGASGLSVVTFGAIHARCFDVTVLSGGKILTVGRVFSGTGTSDFALAQLDANGQLDNTFGVGGKITTDFSGVDDYGETFAIQPDGKIIAAGYTGDILSFTEIAMVRYTSSGTVDNTFGINGKVTTTLGGNHSRAHGIALQPDLKILVGGLVNNGINNFGVARYNNSGMLDSTFDADGRVIIPVSGTSDQAFSIALQADGKIVVGGRAYFANDDFAVIRLHGDMITGTDMVPVSESEEIYLFPNPANDFVNFNNIPSSEAIIRIYDISGRMVLTSTISPHMKSQLNISGLEPGTFICEISSENGKQTLLFTKMK